MALRRDSRGTARDQREDASVDLGRLVIDEVTWYMREHKVARAELAHAMGVSPGRVSQILSGDENLTLRTLGSVVDALGARLEVVLRPEEEPEELLHPVG
ncbi:MAG TPA: helix-turn-helix transcriptional regulator [Micromonosporaceae bacterium]|jgi:transcriptional regulator with XRE-family HTH domain|nr:helix-turn-helix transcriptional regulator [Micromonosporaceae bacterium]